MHACLPPDTQLRAHGVKVLSCSARARRRTCIDEHEWQQPEHMRACLPPATQLRAHGVKVLTVRDILAYNVEENVSARVDLEDLAFTALDYEVRPRCMHSRV